MSTDPTNQTTATAADPDVEIGRKLRAALGHENEPGACQDCGGLGVVPAMALSGRSLWKDCPTCRGLQGA